MRLLSSDCARRCSSLIGCDQQCRVVCICVYCRIWDCFDNVVDVEEEEGCGEGAALRDAVRYCLCF